MRKNSREVTGKGVFFGAKRFNDNLIVEPGREPIEIFSTNPQMGYLRGRK